MRGFGRRRGPLGIRLHPRGNTAEETAAGIYGVIVGAAVMAASHAERATQLARAVIVTLLVYWAAERYARLVAERIHEGHRPSWVEVRRQLTSGWDMITASMLPVAVLLLLKVLGLDLETAIIGALTASTAVLAYAGWHVGRHGKLTIGERFVSALVAGAFGGVLIMGKTLLH
jgi:hypothetical protein